MTEKFLSYNDDLKKSNSNPPGVEAGVDRFMPHGSAEAGLGGGAAASVGVTRDVEPLAPCDPQGSAWAWLEAERGAPHGSLGGWEAVGMPQGSVEVDAEALVLVLLMSRRLSLGGCTHTSSQI